MEKRVFVSSTCYDLIDLRAELKQFLLDNKLSPVMSDEIDSQFTVHETNSIETCLVNLRNSDIVILILSQRYGASLDKAGFGDISATHLEYREAIKHGKKIFVFVRDRLEADYNHFIKTNDPSGLSWIKEKDIKLFELISEHKKLTPNPKNNWYYSFKNSVEIKKRLSVDLKENFNDLRLEYLVENDKMPFLNITLIPDYSIRFGSLSVKVLIDNIGNKPAVNPLISIYSIDGTESELLDEYDGLESLLPFAKSCIIEFKENIADRDAGYSYVDEYILDIKYKNIYGENICETHKMTFKITAFLEYNEFLRKDSKFFDTDEYTISLISKDII